MMMIILDGLDVNEHNDLELWSMLPLLVPGQRALLVPFSIDSNQKMK
jgi:hypothetical protein